MRPLHTLKRRISWKKAASAVFLCMTQPSFPNVRSYSNVLLSNVTFFQNNVKSENASSTFDRLPSLSQPLGKQWSQWCSVREVKNITITKTLHLKEKNTEPTRSPSEPAALSFTRRCSDHLSHRAKEATQKTYANKLLQKHHTTKISHESGVMSL